MENSLYVGFSRVNINPETGTLISGYFNNRFVKGVLDDLEVNCAAFSCADKKAVLMSIDHVGIYKDAMDYFIQSVCEATGLDEAAVYLHATHTHTSGPFFEPDTMNEKILEYRELLCRRITEAAQAALADMKPAKMGTAKGQAAGIAFVRRYVMKDGTIRTNPGVNNPEIDHPAGDVDEEVGVVRFDREDGETIVIGSFACHPDTVGGEKVSADWLGFARRTVEKAIDNTRCIILNGIQGDVNHVNVNPAPGYMNDLSVDFDGVVRGYGHARHMGHAVAGAILQVYDKVEYEDVGSICYLKRDMHIPSYMPKHSEIPEARRIVTLHKAGRDAELPYKGMELTTRVAEALRMLKLEHGPAIFTMPITALAIGRAVFLGTPGEPFNAVGREIKKAKGWKVIIPTCNTNAKEGYFPMMDSYKEGGYEARSSHFAPGAAEMIIKESMEMLNEI